MTREQKIAKARELRAQNVTYSEIGERLGVSSATAWRWLTERTARAIISCRVCGEDFTQTHGKQKYCSGDCRHEAGRLRRRRCAQTIGRAACQDCGTALGEGSAWKGRKRCVTCFEARDAERVDARARKIVAWWAAGRTLAQIRDSLDWSPERLSVEFHRLRELGYDLPYRYKHHANPPRFPEQVAA